VIAFDVMWGIHVGQQTTNKRFLYANEGESIMFMLFVMFYNLSLSYQMYCGLLNIATWIFKGVYSVESKLSRHFEANKQEIPAQLQCLDPSVEHSYK
jgi:hypothetical protein